MEYVKMDLRLFDGAGAGAGAGGAAATGAGAAGAEAAGTAAVPEAGKPGKAPRNPLANIKYGKQVAEGQAQGQERQAAKEPETMISTSEKALRQGEFEKLIKGDYKDLFDERVQGIINERFKSAKAVEEKMSTLSPVLDMLASRYGISGDDPAAIMKALEEDSGFYEQEALEKGLTVEQLREIKRMERENKQFQRMLQAQQEEEGRRQFHAEMMRQAEDVKGMYPSFDLGAEINEPRNGPEFLKLLKSGVPMRTAYEVIHRDEIMAGAMHYTAQQIQKKTVENIRTRGMRPQENGSGGQAAAEMKTDVRSLTREDRREIERRVARGERITF